MADEPIFESVCCDDASLGGRFGVRVRATGRWLPLRFDTECEANTAAARLDRQVRESPYSSGTRIDLEM